MFENTQHFVNYVFGDTRINFDASEWKDGYFSTSGKRRENSGKAHLLYKLQIEFDKIPKKYRTNIREDFFEAFVWKKITDDRKIFDEEKSRR